ncbi:response regulator [Hyphococcus flavus]|uniref:Response regulator n=1 Tax=Hyphococcus flavus TaxID=1866326 RepID=A0AAE9ZCA4_9PROT|nr:response regulator [Hyphococcus flavus]WDI31771.1 response regulator [Hyphococcus flavus]
MTAPKHCLVVEDSELIREIAIRMVDDLGVEADGVDSAEAGVDHCREHQTDIVMLDWDLPSMAALDFLRGVSELEEKQRPEIILCATENDPQQFTLAKAAGARHHILKPFDKDLVAAKFAEIGVIDSQAPTAQKVANSDKR